MTSPFPFVLDNGNDGLHVVDDNDDTLQLTLAFVDEFQLSSSVDSAHAVAATPPPHQSQELLPSAELVSQELLAHVLDDDGASSHFTHAALSGGSHVEQVMSHADTTTVLPQSTAIEADMWLSSQVTHLEPGIFAPIELTTKNKKVMKKQQTQTQLTKSISSGSARRPTTTRHVSNKARDERKEEIIYLHKKVSELEQQLTKHQFTSGSSQIRSSIAAHPGTSSDPPVLPATSVWQEIVSRQYNQRVRAERENIRLKLVLENQLKIAKSLEKVLQKTTSSKDFENLIHRMKPSFALYSLPPQATDPSCAGRVFEELLSGIDESYAEAETIFQANGIAHMETSSVDAVIRSDESVGIELEVFGNKVLPFDMRAAGSVVWHHYAFAKDRIPNRVYHHNSPQTLNATEDTILEDFNLELDVNSATALFHAKSVMRRYTEENRIVIVWRAFFDPLHIANEPTPGVRFLERGYIVIKQSLPTAAGTVNNVLQTCYISTPVMTGDLADADSTILRTIIDFLLRVTAANISSSYEMIENVLLEHMIKAQYVK